MRTRFSLDAQDGDCFHMNTDRSLSVYGYQKQGTSDRIYTIWRDDSIPAKAYPVFTLDFSFAGSLSGSPSWWM